MDRFLINQTTPVFEHLISKDNPPDRCNIWPVWARQVFTKKHSMIAGKQSFFPPSVPLLIYGSSGGGGVGGG